MVRDQVLSDAQWARVEELMPAPSAAGGRPFRDHRRLVEAIVWRYRTGSPWRDLPAEFGPFQTVWKRHDRWSRDGTWERLVAAVQADADAAGDLDWLASVDSTVVRAHQHAAGARRARPDELVEPACSDAPEQVRDVATLTGGTIE